MAANIGHARNLIESMKKGDVHFDFVEVMACSGGCIGGGGQPKTKDPETWAKRVASVYTIDER